MSVFDYFRPPKRNDDDAARRWRGPLFHGLLDPPGSVTFPICCLCGHVIWDWPHFEEPVPKQACCDACAKED